MNFSSVIDAALHNQVVAGLSFTAALGAVAYQLRNIPHWIARGTLRFLTVELTVNSTDPAFDWIDRWLARQPYSQRTKMLSLRSDQEQHDFYSGSPQGNSQEATWTLSPGEGWHMFWWRRRPVFLERHVLGKEGGETRRGKQIERLHFRTVGRSQRIIRQLIEEVKQFSLASNMVTIRIWSDHYWVAMPSKNQRPLDTIILRDGQMERLIDDLIWFHDARDWFIRRGIPYRRGYLFTGPPGSGKTSLVMALAGYFNRPICILSLGSVQDDAALLTAFNEAPANAILLIEDVDCAYPAQSREKQDQETGRLTKAGLLNAIDGIATPDGRILIMTTNYPDRLDPALVRPGRADVHEHFDYLLPSDQVRMAARFYDRPFSPVLFPVAPAALQAAFMMHPDDPQAARHALLKDNELAISA